MYIHVMLKVLMLNLRIKVDLFKYRKNFKIVNNDTNKYTAGYNLKLIFNS